MVSILGGQINKTRDEFSEEGHDRASESILGHPSIASGNPPESICRKMFRFLLKNIDTCERKITNQHVVYPSNYITNKVDNKKYSILTFLPMFLFNQYKVFSNFYFLLIALCQLYEPFKIGFAIGYFGPLGLVTGLSLLKEIWDEYKRKVKDDKVNAEKYIRVLSDREVDIKSSEIKVGDLLKISKNQRVPADVLLLYTSEPSGTVFVRTDQLDGETDWKVREAVKATQMLGPEQLLLSNWTAIAEAPSDLIYDFKGSFYCNNQSFEPLRLSSTIWANMRVANGEVIGLVIYTGKETRMALNAKNASQKMGKTDHEINLLSKFMFFNLGVLTITLYFLSGPRFSKTFYVQIVRTFLLLSSIIPISLKVNIDFAKLYYSFLINNDRELGGTIARNSAIPEELGRIQYLLSDKTGTLTRNEMIFKHLRTLVGEFSEENFQELKNIGLRLFDKESENFQSPSKNHLVRFPSRLEDPRNQDLLKSMFLSLMLCNNVSPIADGSERQLQASSPDEVALVNFAETLGFLMESRTPDSITIRTPDHSSSSWEILENFPFTSETKRMGIILRNKETQEIFFFLKGADSAMIDKINSTERVYVEEETEKLSKEGLRTLVFEYKILSQEQYSRFKQKMENAGKILKLRDQAERKCIEELERNMSLLGITGVEDLLQDDIKSSIMTLRNAGIKVWMLTGDKLETAKCIAISTGFKASDQKFFELNSLIESDITNQLSELRPEHTLIVSGTVLEVIFRSKRLEEIFFNKAKDISSVVLCRCAPKQKAEVTTQLRRRLKKVVCGIGDGGNDVGMIQCADVGIGIEGKEGLQAALASDFSVKKFNQILRLILWHGRLSYVRTSLLNNFVLHRGLVISVIQVLFMTMFYHVTIFIFNGYLTLFYPTVFTSFPVFALILDQDIPIQQAFNYPELYQLVQEGQHISIEEFLSWLWKSIFQGATIILLSLAFLENTFTEFVTIMFTALVFLEYLNIITAIRTWHRYMTLALFFSIMIYLFCLFFLKDLFYFSEISWKTCLQILMITVAAWMPFQFAQSIQRMCFPSQIDKVIVEARVLEKRIYAQNKRAISVSV